MKIKRSTINKLIKEEYKKALLLKEADIDVPAPSSVRMKMQKFIQAVEDANLSRQKKLSILDQVIHSLGIDKRQLGVFTQKVKQNM